MELRIVGWNRARALFIVMSFVSIIGVFVLFVCLAEINQITGCSM